MPQRITVGEPTADEDASPTTTTGSEDSGDVENSDDSVTSGSEALADSSGDDDEDEDSDEGSPSSSSFDADDADDDEEKEQEEDDAQDLSLRTASPGKIGGPGGTSCPACGPPPPKQQRRPPRATGTTAKTDRNKTPDPNRNPKPLPGTTSTGR